MDNITLTIDRQQVTVPAGSTILTAARSLGIEIPTLCDHPDQKPKAACRVCVVELEGARTLVPSCAYPASDGMVIKTNSPKVREARKTTIELLLAHHPQDCLQCIRNLNCELQTVAQQQGIREISFPVVNRELSLDTSNPSLVRDPNKCINCRRCVEACTAYQGTDILYSTNRGFDTVVAPAFASDLAENACVLCGQCLQACPVGAIYEQNDVNKVWDAINDPNKHVVVQTAPAVRVALGEELGQAPGSIVTGKMVAGIRQLGFDKVFDTDFTADLTILEEGHELLERLQNGGTLPMLTSCSPGWIKFIEHFYPDLTGHLSSCKSPQQMFGALAKSYYPEKEDLDAKDIFVVSVMPCTAKKYEAERPEMNDSGYKDVDVVLTTRELGQMFREAGIHFDKLEEEEYDAPLGISTGAGAIFGATGGVMEAALRTVYEVVVGEALEDINLTVVRGLEGIKAASIDLAGTTVKVAVAHGLANARKLMDQIAAGEADYHFIEIMCCPGGCIGGGGQPIPTTMEVRQKRIDATYQVDTNMKLRKSHENPAVQALYQEYLKKPLGEKSHHLLHTHYTKRKRY